MEEPSKPVYIYALCDPDTKIVRYIGKTRLSLKQRLSCHLSANKLKSKSHKNHWIKSLLNRELKPEIILLDIGNESSWRELECFHIRSHRAAGFDLTNGTDGGDGSIGHIKSEEERAGISLRMMGNQYGLGVVHTEEWKSQKSVAWTGENNPNYGRTFSDEYRAKLSQAHMGQSRPFTEEHRANISKAKSGENHQFFSKTFSEEHRAKLSKARREYLARKREEKKEGTV